MKRRVITIPATMRRSSGMSAQSIEKRRVAGYARVSTDDEEQLLSYQAQLDYYTSFIGKISRKDLRNTGEPKARRVLTELIKNNNFVLFFKILINIAKYISS